MSTIELIAKGNGTNEPASFLLDSFLESFDVPRQNAIYEMTLPGLILGPDQLVAQLNPAAALTRVVYRLTENTGHLAQFLYLVREKPEYLDNNRLTPAGIEMATEEKVIVEIKVPLKDSPGYRIKKEEKTLLEAALIQNGKRIAIVDRDGIYINPNAQVLPTAELEDLMGVKNIAGNTFFLPASVAEGLLLKPTEDTERKQSTSMRVTFPDGAYLLEAWFRAGDRRKRLQRDKWIDA